MRTREFGRLVGEDSGVSSVGLDVTSSIVPIGAEHTNGHGNASLREDIESWLGDETSAEHKDPGGQRSTLSANRRSGPIAPGAGDCQLTFETP